MTRKLDSESTVLQDSSSVSPEQASLRPSDAGIMATAQYQESHIPLLRDTIDVLLYGAKYFTGDSSKAKKARKKLDKKDPGWYASLSADALGLADLVRNVPDAWLGDTQAREAVCSFLDTVQTDFLKPHAIFQEDDEEEDGDEDGSEKGANSQHVADDAYNVLRALLSRMSIEYPPAEDSNDDKAHWLCERVKFEQTTTATRACILGAIELCSKAFRLRDGPSRSSTSQQPVDHSITLIETPLFASAESLHKSVSTWNCDCFPQGAHYRLHQQTCFSFLNRHGTGQTTTCGSLSFRTERNRTKVWKLVDYEYRKPDEAPGAIAALEHANICRLLDTFKEGQLIRLAGLAATLEPFPGGGRRRDLIPNHASPHTSWLDLTSDHVIYKMTPKRRMKLALYLAYAYLHLSGGVWWSYTRKTSILFANDREDDGSITAYFEASSIQDEEVTSSTARMNAEIRTWPIACRSNRNMPSLVALGRLILSLFCGRHVSWDDAETELANIVDEPCAAEVTRAVNACFFFNHEETTDAQMTIRDSPNHKAYFVQNVVLPLQAVLVNCYRVKINEVFAAPAPPRIEEVTRLRPLAPPPAEGTQVAPAQYTLHDDGDKTEAGHEGTTADAYMADLQRCFASTLRVLCPKAANIKRPVRIAVLDTGVDICSEYREHVYDGRLKEAKTWLHSSGEEGEHLFDPDTGEVHQHALDSHGHGTHGISTILQATVDSDFEVYAAQVFQGSAEKQAVLQNGSNAKASLADDTTKRVADAIRHAVDAWRVDVISMSFGCPEEVDEISEALTYAEEANVLLIAAASNCGGNHRCSWPARDTRVMCIYATDGQGNKYRGNPDPTPHKANFATLGCSVKALGRSVSGSESSPMVRRSGTSTAAPLAAVIAGLVIATMRQSEDQYFAAQKLNRVQEEKRREAYKKKLQRLGRAQNMSEVFGLMLGVNGHRDGYQYITPWTLFNDKTTASALAERILFGG